MTDIKIISAKEALAEAIDVQIKTLPNRLKRIEESIKMHITYGETEWITSKLNRFVINELHILGYEVSEYEEYDTIMHKISWEKGGIIK